MVLSDYKSPVILTASKSGPYKALKERETSSATKSELSETFVIATGR
jgi:hypothetical protein